MAGRAGQRKRAKAKAVAAAVAVVPSPAVPAIVPELCGLVDEWRTKARSGVDCAKQLEDVLRQHGHAE